METHPEEPFAANAVATGSGVIYGAGFDKTCERLEDAGIRVFEVDMSELQKAEGAVTCCSILL
jgi:dimethylargininase